MAALWTTVVVALAILISTQPQPRNYNNVAANEGAATPGAGPTGPAQSNTRTSQSPSTRPATSSSKPSSSPGTRKAKPSASPVASNAGVTLTWAPPTLLSPTTVSLCDCNLWGNSIIVNLAAGHDYILKDTVTLHHPVQIHGGHNIVWIGGEVAPTSGPDIGIQVGWGAGEHGGTIHLEGIYLHGYLTDGIEGGEYAGLSVASGTIADATLQIENVRIEGMTGDSSVTHQDCIQHYGGWANLRVDHLTCHTPYQGFELPWEDGASNNQGVLKHWDIRNANLYDMTPSGASFQTLIHFGDRNGYFNSTTHQQSGYLSNVYLDATQRSFNQETYPNAGTTSTDGTVVHATIESNGTITWSTSWAIPGFVTPGVPPGGDFVPIGVAGLGYVG